MNTKVDHLKRIVHINNHRRLPLPHTHTHSIAISKVKIAHLHDTTILLLYSTAPRTSYAVVEEEKEGKEAV